MTIHRTLLCLALVVSTAKANLDKVFCFKSMFDEGKSSCHVLESNKVDPIECCRSHKKAGGFYASKEIINKERKTFLCEYCKNEVGMASGWTEWSLCSVSCGGGYRTRNSRCPTKYCYNSTTEQKTCNEYIKCPESSTMAPALICVSVVLGLLGLLMLGFLIKYLMFKKRRLSARKSIDQSETTSTEMSSRKTGIEWASSVLRYQTTPIRSVAPSPNVALPALPVAEDPDQHTYESLLDINEEMGQRTYESLADDDSYYLSPIQPQSQPQEVDYLVMN